MSPAAQSLGDGSFEKDIACNDVNLLTCSSHAPHHYSDVVNRD
jgi:hypothetical protein